MATRATTAPGNRRGPIQMLESIAAWFFRGVNVLVYVYLAIPLVIVLLASVTPTSYLRFPPSGFTLRWYSEMATGTGFLESLWLSLWLAAIATILATTLGILCSFALVRFQFVGRDVISTIILSPLLLPGIIAGIALLQFMSRIGMGASFGRLVIGHVIIITPYVVRSITATLIGFDRTIEDAAMSLGANRWRTIRMITLPVIKSGVIAGAIFAFITSFDNVSISLFLSTPQFTPLPIQIYQYIEYSAKPVIAAISTLQIVVIVVVMLVMERLVGFSKQL